MGPVAISTGFTRGVLYPRSVGTMATVKPFQNDKTPTPKREGFVVWCAG